MSCVNASTKREIRQFHVEVVQRGQRNVQKKHDARAKLLFCQSKPIAFLPSLLPSPLPQLSILDLLMTFRVFFLISYIFNQTAPQPTPSALNSTSLAYEHGVGREFPTPVPKRLLAGYRVSNWRSVIHQPYSVTRKQTHRYM